MSPQVDQGAVAEYRFASELLARNIIPCWPSTETRPYDLIADTGDKRHKIQVKGTSRTGPIIDVQFMMKAGKKHRRYTKEEIDFIVLFIFEYSVWYVFPIDDVETGVRIKPMDPKCKYRIYRDAWHLLK